MKTNLLLTVYSIYLDLDLALISLALLTDSRHDLAFSRDRQKTIEKPKVWNTSLVINGGHWQCFSYTLSVPKPRTRPLLFVVAMNIFIELYPLSAVFNFNGG